MLKRLVKRENLILLIIILVGLFFRIYHFKENFSFAHDQDLYSWIAKDIVVNHHLRTVGQLTSVDGVFIGPLYYYIIAIFYAIFRMNPISAEIPVTLIGLATIFSFYFVIRKTFNKNVGLLAAFIYAVSCGIAFFDRWSVPTQPTMLWSIWFLYLIFEMEKGNIKLLPLYGAMVALVWHVHIALLPVTVLPLLAYLLSNGDLNSKFSKLSFKLVIVSLLVFLSISAPFWIFELKHNFSQVKSTILATHKDLGNPTGVFKLNKIFNASAKEFQDKLAYSYEHFSYSLMWLVLVVVSLIAGIKKIISFNKLTLMYLWIGLILLAQFISKRLVSEYYFSNLIPIYILIISVLLNDLTKKYKFIIIGILFAFLFFNVKSLLNLSVSTESYAQRERLVDYIKADMTKNNYSCAGINYIANFGNGVGFRYLYWYKNIQMIKPSNSVPVYNIVIPLEISKSEINESFGRFGLILPKGNRKYNFSECNLSGNQLDPLLGYVE